jgi:Nucleoside-diphosphate-sugar epimerases
MDKTIFIVTGAAGHLGSYVVRELLSQGKAVRALVLPNEACPDFIDENRHLLREYVGNVCDPGSIAPLFEGNSTAGFIVIHCAGIVMITEKEDKRVYDVNVSGTANIIDACKRYSVRLLISIQSI